MRIIGTGSFLPPKVWTNDDLSAIVDTNDDWIRSRTGIEERHIADVSTSELAIAAAKDILGSAKVVAQDIDLIVVATSTPDSALPSVANRVQKALGNTTAMVFDLNAACSGFVFAMDVAKSLMKARGFKFGMVIGAEKMSKIIDWKDRNTCVLFGDGASGVLLSAEDTFLYTHCASTPDYEDVLVTGEHSGFIEMKGSDVFKFAVSTVCKEIDSALEATKLTREEIDYFILHQANARISEYAVKRLKLSAEKFYMNIKNLGNTSAASIPLVIDEMHKNGHLKRGMKVLLCGFGAGLSFGTILLEW